MNRQIKFRGKRYPDGEWVYGDLLRIGGGCLIYYGSKTELQTPDIPKESEVFVELLNNEVAVVVPDTVGQFTGLLDRNGKEIFEDDILKLDFDKRICIEKVEYRDGRFVSVDPQMPYKADALYLWLKDATVIGNIHDNSELLKGGDYGRSI